MLSSAFKSALAPSLTPALTPARTSAMALSAHQAQRFAAPVRVRTRTGLLWITVDGEPEDILLAEGQCRRFDSAAPVIVYALGGDAQFEIAANDAAAAAGPRRWGGHWIGRLGARLSARLATWLRSARPVLGARA